MVIDTPIALAERYNIPPDFLMLAAQTTEGGLPAYFRVIIQDNGGESRILCRRPEGAGVLTAGEVFQIVFKQPFEVKRRRAK